MMRAYVNGIGLLGPGLEGQNQSQKILSGNDDWQVAPLPKIVVEMLPANERRRTTPLIKLALHVAKLALDDAGVKPDQLASVFASSDGDLEIVHKLCEALVGEVKAVSPTQFHNSVHNAPSGYWAIAARSHAPSTSISAADASFAAGLMESMIQVTTTQKDVLLVAYDYPPPAPLDKKRNITMPFGIALLLGPVPGNKMRASLFIEPDRCINASRSSNRCQNASLEELRKANPAARGLPLLEALGQKQNMDIALPYLTDQSLIVHIQS